MSPRNLKDLEIAQRRFPKIFKKGKSRPRKPRWLNEIYEVIKKAKEPIKISEISKITNLKINTVRTYIRKYLEKQKYVRKHKKYTPPYLMIEPLKRDPEFIYGKENRDRRVEEEITILKKISDKLGKKEKGDLFKVKIYDGRFFKWYNLLVEKLRARGFLSLNKMRIGSGANRYVA